MFQSKSLLVGIYLYLPEVHNPESTQKILRTQFKKRKRNGRLGKLVLDSTMIKKTAAESKTKGRKQNPHATCKVRCQGKVTGVLF